MGLYLCLLNQKRGGNVFARIIRCGDKECIHHNGEECIAPELDHTTDRFCIFGRRKPKEDSVQMMQASEPKGYKRRGKYVSN